MTWNFQPNLYQVKTCCCLPAVKALAERSRIVQKNDCKGFTLLELLVVIGLLALISAAAVISLDDVGQHAALQITKTEMIEVRKALRQFRHDIGRFPDTSEPADFSQLTSRTLPATLGIYSADTGRGWRGPYLTSDGNGLVTVGTNLDLDGTGTILGAPVSEVAGVADEFTHTPAANNVLAWRQCTDLSNAACAYQAKFGRPFLLFDLADPDARLVSMGPDGRYDGINAADACIPNNDDLVVCLR